MSHHAPSSRKMQSLTLASCLALLVFALSFNAWLSTKSLERSYLNSLVAGYSIAASEPVIEIEYALKYGKLLNQFYGISEIMGKISKNAPSLENVRIVSDQGNVLYDLQGDVLDNKMVPLLSRATFESFTLMHADGKNNLFFPIRDRNGVRVGSINMVFDHSVVDNRMGPFIGISLICFFAVLAVAVIILILVFYRVRVNREKPMPMRRLLVIMLGLIIVAQCTYTSISLYLFREAYQEIVKENGILVAGIVQREVSGVLKKGVSYEELYQVDAWMRRIIKSAPEIALMSISDPTGKELYRSSLAEAAPFDYRLQLLPVSGEQPGFVNLALSQKKINEKVRDVGLDLLTALITAIFFAMELMGFFLIFSRAVIASKMAGRAMDSLRQLDIARPMVFLCYFFYHMTISFIPMQMQNIYRPLWGIPEKVVLGLPISMEVICVGIAALLSGFYIDRKGWRFPLLAGISVASAGFILSGLAYEPVGFILSRAVVGLGFGICLTAMESYIAVSLPDTPKAARFPRFFAGMFAGSACGVALGAIIADNINFSTTFLIAGIGMVVPFLFVYFFGHEDAVVSSRQDELPTAVISKSALRSFFGTREVALFLLMIAIPAMLCRIGFLYYFFPLYGTGKGLSTADIGRAFMIYAMCFVFLQPFFSRFLSHVTRMRLIVFAGGCLCVGGLLIFSWQDSVAAAFVAVLLIGLADTAGTGAQSAYLLSLQATHNYGNAKSLSAYRATRKIGETLGPLVFSWVLIMGTQSGVGWVGAGYLVCLFLFLLGSRKDRIVHPGDRTVIYKESS
jgi:predicted MFS family arabinose efflux permease